MKRHGLVIWLQLTITLVVQARDRIVIQPPDKVSPLVIAGDVADYNADWIEIHLTVGKDVHRYPAAHVVSVETVQTEAHQAGVRSFAAGELDVAVERFEEALRDEPRNWVRREILGWLIRIAMRRDQRALAGDRFLQIIALDPDPREYAVAPLVWGAESIGSDTHQRARLWLTGSSDVERLLGASVLLQDVRFGETAQAEMSRLARVGDARVASLARSQLWRLRTLGTDVTDNEMASWESTIAGLPPELRAGPTYVLGRAALGRSEFDRAAAAFLWIPTVYNEQEPLAAEAAIGAANALDRVGRLHEARQLLMTLTAENQHWANSAEAAALLEKLAVQTESNQ